MSEVMAVVKATSSWSRGRVQLHEEWGHASKEVMEIILRANPEIKPHENVEEAWTEIQNCYVCRQAKQQRADVPHVIVVPVEMLGELVVCDFMETGIK